MLQKLKVVGYSNEFTFWNLKKVLDDTYYIVGKLVPIKKQAISGLVEPGAGDQ